MRIFNAGTQPVDATLTFYSQTGSEPLTKTLPFDPGQVSQINQVLPTLFGLTNDGGALHITSAQAMNLVATAAGLPPRYERCHVRPVRAGRDA